MFARYFQTLSNCFKIPELRSRIVFTLLLLLVCRLIALIPVPGLDGALLADAFADLAKKASEDGSGTSLLGMYSMFTGGAMEQCALGSLGIMPYISATIIFQLLTVVIPKLEQLKKEGDDYLFRVVAVHCLIELLCRHARIFCTLAQISERQAAELLSQPLDSRGHQ